MKSLDTLMEKHGILGVQFEQFLYRMADNFSKDYNGGFWKAKQVEGDESGFYLSLDNDTTYTIQNTQNQYSSGDMDSETFALSIFAFACNIAGCQAYEKGNEAFADDLLELFGYCQRNALEILGDEKKHAQYHWFLD